MRRLISLLLYLDNVFGTRDSGILCIAVGSEPLLTETGAYRAGKWKQHHYQWPDKVEDVVTKILDCASHSDVYVCPYLMRDEHRHKGNALSRHIVHADIDAQVDLEKVKAVKGFVVGSGTPGHGHVYVRLNESVPTVQHEALCRGLGAHLGNADPKISDNDLLRPPGTFNHKPTITGGTPLPVDWVVKP